ncbi:hypothetical protein ABT169_17515 [Streptomyces sp. NPDC001616]|uniref:hypothetical protein n=1 Tax=Streptomyces sp. NPDC001616 TaxID=3156648 RepID=UPI00332C8FE5
MHTAALPTIPHAITRPLDASHVAYALSNADRPAVAVPVSGALVRSLLASTLHCGGTAALEPDTDAVTLSWPQIGGMVPGRLGPVFHAVPCDRPARTPCCARCGHWEGEHDHPAVPTACNRYRLSIGPARYAMPDRDNVTYAWVRRMGRSRIRFEITDATEAFPGGALIVHRLPALGDGPYGYGVHFATIPKEQRTAVLERARARVHPQPCTA